jgi:2-dehydro-3-deoxygalactonokinase
MGEAAVLIGVDWGNSNLRAYRFGADGRLIERRAAPAGVHAASRGGFEAALAEAVRGWIGPPILLCGAIGSREGWREAPYVPCPAGEMEIAAALTPLSTELGRAWIVPGVSAMTRERAETMRGEETKAAALLAEGFEGVMVSPGTHAKWVRLQGGRITGLRSFMTGELFAVLQDHSLLGALVQPGPHDAAAFELGVQRALTDPAVTSLLLTARAEALLGRMAAAAIPSYLSGLLIGAEVAGGLADLDPGTPIAVVGSPGLTPLLTRALALAGRADAAAREGEAALAAGLWRLGRGLTQIM